ncbi:sugar ABC transporter permease [Nocardioides sp. C4-1]|uniref:carbohydrate ABC transporter permease n=1 Tax=Nocardioides sp. C4-1 TaxID=3151851 RepID=UPI00326302E0
MALVVTPEAPVVPLPEAPGGAPRRRRPRGLRGLTPYVLMVPALAALALALGYPLVRQVALSFQDFGLEQQFGAPAEQVGLDNYRALLADSYLWTLVFRTVAFCLVNAGLTLVIGLAIALLLRSMSRSVRLMVQSALLLAWAMPVISAVTVWEWLFDSQYGVVNWLLTRLGGDYQGHSWLIDPLSFFLVATLVVVWMSVPFVAFTLHAALLGVADDVVEAAEVDGAGAWQRLRHVLLPGIRPVLLVVALLQIVWDLRVFTQIYKLQGAGGVTRETNLLGTYIYRSGISEGEFGTAATAAIFMLALTVVLTAPYVVRMLREERES